MGSNQSMKTLGAVINSKFITSFILSLIFTCSPIAASEQSKESDVTRLNFGEIIGSINQQVGILLLRNIYQRLNIQIFTTPMSSKRSIVESNYGRKDGELLRIKSANQSYPALIRVPSSIYYIQSQMFTLPDLQGTAINQKFWNKAKFARVGGVLHAQQAVEKYNIKHVHTLINSRQLFNFVSQGRADVAITSRLNGLHFSQSQNTPTLTKLGTPLLTQPLYHFLNRKYAFLVPKIDKIIQNMRNSGELDQLINQYEQQVINTASHSKA